MPKSAQSRACDYIRQSVYVISMRTAVNFFSALADPTRLRLLHLMKNGEICVCFLQGVLQTNQPKVSRHLAYLKKAGLVKARRQGKWMHYSLGNVEPALKKILLEVIGHLDQEMQTQKDLKRLQKITCCPSNFGIAYPGVRSKSCRESAPCNSG